MDLNPWLNFVREIDNLKGVERKTLTQNRYENSAEHSWHLATGVLAYFRCFSPSGIDLTTALEMALLHDIVEIDAGDTFIYGDNSQKKEKEEQAANRIFGILPAAAAQKLQDRWESFESGDSQEAKLVSAIDRFLPILSNYLNQGHSWKKHGVKLSQVLDKNRAPILDGAPALWKYTEELLEQAVAKGFLDP